MKGKLNVNIRLGCRITDYDKDDATGMVKRVQINGGEQVDCDAVVLCLGPQVRGHVRDHFGTIFPLLTGQGYSVNLPDHDPKLDAGVNYKLHDRGCTYTQLRPGKHRLCGLMDIGCHEQSFLDPRRVNYLRSIYETDFNIQSAEEDWRDLWSGLRPLSPDDLPIVGPMAYYPNVVINAGHNGNGIPLGISSGKIVQELLDANETKYFS